MVLVLHQAGGSATTHTNDTIYQRSYSVIIIIFISRPQTPEINPFLQLSPSQGLKI